MGFSISQWGALAVGAVTLTLANSIIIEPAIAQSEASPTRPGASVSGSSGRSSQATLLFVNPAQGQDDPAAGTEATPLRTITYALSRAEPNTVIFLSPGTYTRSSGEIFPLRLRSRVTLYGNPQQQGQGVMIAGGGLVESAYGRQHTAIVGVDGAGVNGVTVSNRDGHGIWLESGRFWIVNSTFDNNGNQGVAIAPRADAPSQNNRFVNNRGGNIGRLAPRQSPESSQETVAAASPPQSPSDSPSNSGIEILSWGNASALSMQQRSPSTRFDKPQPQVPQLAHRPPRSYRPPTSTVGQLRPLPVPDGNVPIGDRGHLPLPATTILSSNPSAPPPPPTYASANVPPTRLQFRITVLPRNSSDIELVQLLMPDALTLRRRDGSITQSAAFRHRDRAEAVLEELRRNGIQASLQALNS